MIKKLIIAILLMVPSMAFAQKFGTVDVQSFMSTMPEIQEMQTTMDAFAKKYEDELQALQEKLQKDYEAYQAMANDPNTLETIKQRRQQELNEQMQKIQAFQQQAQQDLQQQEARLLQPIQERIRQAIDAVGTEGSFTFIFEKAMPIFVGGDAIDVTPLVKAKLGIN